MTSYWRSIATMALSHVVYEILTSNNIATLKSRWRANQGHWKWYHSVDWLWLDAQFLRYSTCKYIVTLKPRIRGNSRSSAPTRIDPPPTTFYWRSIATMGLSRTVTEINGDFSRKSQISPTPMYFAPPAEGIRGNSRSSALELGICGGVKKLEWCGYWAE